MSGIIIGLKVGIIVWLLVHGGLFVWSIITAPVATDAMDEED